ncbi:hypothetical protein Ae201684P_003566 [Aphanomyces euteiches]|uniref:Crinkler effector protein N-terminal domain-containing protein n=1 Tax=Aphanomyces euteiches TaxID=100861 RepID=A0A6G0WNW8_9STRA|nr:hypothetical protein Ae201684_013204 [Aphanomyces euteiches]KAH9064784.1 hypothetical protein Ae201684P_003566 [Aphanomyces euteiches]KAH9143444.1 hypothetical protein AeRB84_012549 [Aphanomyces euteiches]
MLTLFCLVVGERTPFSVDVAANETVGDLKKMIKEENSNTLTCDAKELQLYLALKGHAWLESTSLLVERLMKGETPDEIHEYLVEANKMNPFSKLTKALNPPLVKTNFISWWWSQKKAHSALRMCVLALNFSI